MVEAPQRAYHIANVGAYAKLGHPPDVDGDLHPRHLTTDSSGSTADHGRVDRGWAGSLASLCCTRDRGDSGSHFGLRFCPAICVKRKRLAKVEHLLANFR